MNCGMRIIFKKKKEPWQTFIFREIPIGFLENYLNDLDLWRYQRTVNVFAYDSMKIENTQNTLLWISYFNSFSYFS